MNEIITYLYARHGISSRPIILVHAATSLRLQLLLDREGSVRYTRALYRKLCEVTCQDQAFDLAKDPATNDGWKGFGACRFVHSLLLFLHRNQPLRPLLLDLMIGISD